MEPDVEATYKWNAVAKRIEELIGEGRYMTSAELERIPAYERLMLARMVNSFYYNLPEEYESPIPKELPSFGYNREDWEALHSFFDDDERLDATLRQMEYLFENTPESDSYYQRNDALTLGYNGMQLFSSTADRTVGNTLTRYGLAGLGLIYGHKGATIALDSLLGIRYLMAAEAPNDYYLPAAEQDGLTAYENYDAFPLAFAAPSSVREYTMTPRPLQATDYGPVIEREDALALQNQLFAALGQEVFLPVPIIETQYEALSAKKQPNGDNQLTYDETAEGISTVHMTALTPGEGPVYAYWAMRHESGLGTLRHEGRDLQSLTTSDTPLVAYVGDYWADEEIQLDFELESEGITLVQEALYQLDTEALTALCDRAYETEMYDTEWKGGQLSGTVDVTDERDTLLLTVPFDRGWSATVNGTPVEVERGLSLFCAVPLSQGRNFVRMSYSPPGFRMGLLISGLAMSGLLAFLILRRVLAKRGWNA